MTPPDPAPDAGGVAGPRATGEAWLPAVLAAVDAVAGTLVPDGARPPVGPDDLLVSDLGLDSLALYELAVRLDAHVPGFELPEDLHPHDVTARDVAHYLALAIGSRPPGAAQS